MSSMTDVRRDTRIADIPPPSEKSPFAMSWAAIIGGAVAASVISLILLLLGSALGLSSVSPWSQPETVASVTAKTIIWIIVMQWIASGIGGYLTGRLRTRWLGTPSDEVFFRDTAHGFLAWSVATLLMATLLTSAATTVIGGGVQVSATVAASAPRPEPIGGYYIDSLLRSPTPNANAPAPEVRAETTGILAMGLKNGSVPDADKTYLAQVVAARTGLSEEDAARRVDDTIAQINSAKEQAKEKAEEARKTAMHVSLYLFLSLLVGAFISSSAAALGGRHRDEY